MLEIATNGFGDRDLDRLVVGVDIVRGGGCGAIAGAGPLGDGQGLAVGQGDGHGRASGDRRDAILAQQGGAVSDDAALGHARCRGQLEGGGVIDIGDAGDHRGLVAIQRAEVAAAGRVELLADARGADIDIVSGLDQQFARGRTGLDGNGLAAFQGDRDRVGVGRDGLAVTVHQAGGIGDGAAFED